jgi:hypothetical protein
MLWTLLGLYGSMEACSGSQQGPREREAIGLSLAMCLGSTLRLAPCLCSQDHMVLHLPQCGSDLPELSGVLLSRRTRPSYHSRHDTASGSQVAAGEGPGPHFTGSKKWGNRTLPYKIMVKKSLWHVGASSCLK